MGFFTARLFLFLYIILYTYILIRPYVYTTSYIHIQMKYTISVRQVTHIPQIHVFKQIHLALIVFIYSWIKGTAQYSISIYIAIYPLLYYIYDIEGNIQIILYYITLHIYNPKNRFYFIILIFQFFSTVYFYVSSN